MKKLTIEQKAKAYDEALERAKKLYEQGTITESLSYVFPELKESEEERIRKAIVERILDTPNLEWEVNYNFSKEKALAWLEKQGESDETKAKIFLINKGYPIDTNAIFPTYEEMYNIIREGLEEQGEKPQGKSTLELWKDMRFEAGAQASGNRHEPPMSDSNSKLFSLNDINEIMEKITEKQGEQKPIIEMKSPEESLGISSEEYNKIVDACLYDDKVEPKFHEGQWITNGEYTWKIVKVNTLDYTLQSPDGHIVDGLISYADEQFHFFNIEDDAKKGDILRHNGCTFIFICIENGIVQGFEDDLLNGMKTCNLGKPCEYNDYHPATKEQRDLLFQRMKESGYEWDADKKELKEIEQKSDWSEEDVAHIDELTDFFEHCGEPHQPQENVVKWLKSLKQRIGE